MSDVPEMVNLAEMLRRITGDLERASSDYREAQEQLEAVRAHRDELRAMVDGTRLLVARYGQDDQPKVPGPGGQAGSADGLRRAIADAGRMPG
jgi:hypothetical protein